MEAKHTPGRWGAAARPSSIVGWPVVAAPLGRSICSVSFIFVAPGQPLTAEEEAFNRESAANARLIASAPALLEALKRLWPDNLGVVPDHLPDDFVFPIDFTAGELRRVAAAISQAEGGE